MCTERFRRSFLLPCLVCCEVLIYCFAACVFTSSARSQDYPIHVTGSTQVQTISFRFTDTKSFREEDLLSRIALTPRGKFIWLRNTFDFLPFVTPVGEHLFDPLELQRDVIRLRHFYHSAGFLKPVIDYTVTQASENDLVITEGPPLVLRTVTVVNPADSSRTESIDQLLRSWARSASAALPQTGDRLNLNELPAAIDQQRLELMNSGYPDPVIRPTIVIDSLHHLADLTFHVEPGTRARFGEIMVTGARSVGNNVITRELPFSQGDPYSLAKMSEGRREILELGIFRQALVNAGRRVLRIHLGGTSLAG